MNFIDIVLGGLLVFGIFKGLKNGFFVEIASLIALIAGIYGAIHFSFFVGDYLGTRVDWQEKYINITAFIITFIAIILAVSLAGKLLTKVADFAALGIFNKILGGLFGGLKIGVILGAALLFLHKTNNAAGLIKEDTIKESVLYEPVKTIGAIVFGLVFNDEEERL